MNRTLLAALDHQKARQVSIIPEGSVLSFESATELVIGIVERAAAYGVPLEAEINQAIVALKGGRYDEALHLAATGAQRVAPRGDGRMYSHRASAHVAIAIGTMIMSMLDHDNALSSHASAAMGSCLAYLIVAAPDQNAERRWIAATIQSSPRETATAEQLTAIEKASDEILAEAAPNLMNATGGVA